jgi:hypothetical protein
VNQRIAVQNHADYVVEEGRESVGDRNCDEEQRVRQEVFGARSLDLGPLLKKPKARSETDDDGHHGHNEDAQPEEGLEETVHKPIAIRSTRARKATSFQPQIMIDYLEEDDLKPAGNLI